MRGSGAAGIVFVAIFAIALVVQLLVGTTTGPGLVTSIIIALVLGALGALAFAGMRSR